MYIRHLRVTDSTTLTLYSLGPNRLRVPLAGRYLNHFIVNDGTLLIVEYAPLKGNNVEQETATEDQCATIIDVTSPFQPPNSTRVECNISRLPQSSMTVAAPSQSDCCAVLTTNMQDTTHSPKPGTIEVASSTTSIHMSSLLEVENGVESTVPLPDTGF
jgi:hypothetical protein